MQYGKVFLLALMTAIGLSIVGSCETWRDECADYGEVIVVNPIPDTTIYFNDDPLIIDLMKPPVVLQQTEGQSISILVSSDDRSIVEANSTTSPTTDRLNAIKVTPRTAGTTTVRIYAEDSCG